MFCVCDHWKYIVYYLLVSPLTSTKWLLVFLGCNDKIKIYLTFKNAQDNELKK